MKVKLNSVFKTMITTYVDATEQEIIDYNTSGEWPRRWIDVSGRAEDRAVKNARAHGIELDFEDCWVS